MTDSAVDLANQLNRDCDCVGTDVAALHVSLGDTLADCGLGQPIAETHPHLFSEAPVFIAAAHMRQMQGVIDAVEAVTRLDAYRDSVLRSAPEIARVAPANGGVFLGFDFHIAADGPKLIEINTNAGGALLNLEAMRERRECCRPMADSPELPSPADQLEDELFAMFLREWRLARGDEPLRRIAIVDANPDQQYLYPEFLLFQRLFESHGIDTVIADPAELSFARGMLTHSGRKIDLVYNRLTDFYLADPAHRALAEAYVSNAAVVTPHPHAHALYSNKCNLALLSDEAALRSMGVVEADITTLLRGIPRTVVLNGAEEQWWPDRKRWFFKPAMGFGSRGSYRGDKLTRRVFAEIMEGGYVAQRLEPPSERWRNTAAGKTSYKIDVRNYVYARKIQLTAARLYQGQTTNFRTAGGGFASVFPAPPWRCITNAMKERVTPDGRYFVVRGRLWRRANPNLPVERRDALVHDLGNARRAVQSALRSGDATALAAARKAVDVAKIGLGERGPVWWTDGAPDLNRHKVKDSPYAEWYGNATA